MKFARIIIFALCIAGAFYFFYPRHTKQFSSCDDLISFCKYKMYDDLVKVWGEPTEKKIGEGKTYYIIWHGVGINGVDKTLMFELGYIGNGAVEMPFQFQGVECDSNPSISDSNASPTTTVPDVSNSTSTTSAVDTQNSQVNQKNLIDNNIADRQRNATSKTNIDSVELISTVVERGGKIKEVLTSKLPVTYCSGKLKFTFKMQNDTLKCDFADEGGYYLSLPCVQANNIINLVGNSSFFAVNSGLLWFVKQDQHYKTQLYTCK